MHSRDQTIYALSSGRPPAAIAIVRVSGPHARAAVETLARKLPTPRHATRVLLRDGGGQPIDDAIVLWFPQPASETGEDVAEFHIHGGRAVLAALIDALAAIPGLRAAEPGEFTRRAFENGKIDLTEAEGLDDLIHADTDRQRRQALRGLQGLLGDRARDWRARIIRASALIEAGIDFADESDVPDDLTAPALAAIATLHDEIADVLAAQGRSERLRDGLVVVIAGRPNVGKSTLLNWIARREVAIVSPVAGTTRDVIEVQIDLDGYPVTLIDTAGIRVTDDPVEQEGVRRAQARAASADLVLWLIDGEGDDPGARPGADDASGAPVWMVRTKRDLLAGGVAAWGSQQMHPMFAISAVRGDGLPSLMAAVTEFAAQHLGGFENGLLGRARHRLLLTETVDALARARNAAGSGDELLAEELRIAADRLGRLLGRIDVEDMLDVVFREFCIGK